MNTFKKELFATNRPGESFPNYKALSAEERSVLVQALALRLGVDGGQPAQVRDCVFDLTEQVGRLVDEPGQELREILQNCDVGIDNASVLVDWCAFDEVDELVLQDFLAAFDCLWLPVSEDIEVVDSEMRWIVSIHHEGDVGLLRLPELQGKARSPDD